MFIGWVCSSDDAGPAGADAVDGQASAAKRPDECMNAHLRHRPPMFNPAHFYSHGGGDAEFVRKGPRKAHPAMGSKGPKLQRLRRASMGGLSIAALAVAIILALARRRDDFARTTTMSFVARLLVVCFGTSLIGCAFGE
jgi:hypothetical protein